MYFFVCDFFSNYDVFVVSFVGKLWCISDIIDGIDIFDIGFVIFIGYNMGMVDFDVCFFQVDVFYVIYNVNS